MRQTLGIKCAMLLKDVIRAGYDEEPARRGRSAAKRESQSRCGIRRSLRFDLQKRGSPGCGLRSGVAAVITSAGRQR